MFPILLHSSFYERLRESDAAFRARVRKTLVRLRDGRWGGGTRVKRLAGLRAPVYEARIDSGDRLLFTAVASSDRDFPERLRTHLQIWDVVHHDEVRRASRRNRSPEAEFLEFDVLEHYDIAEPPPHPAASFGDAGDDSGEVLLEFLIPPEGFHPRDQEGITGAARWYLAAPFMLADETEFQRIMDSGGAELELKLVRDQYEILRAPGPVLLAGSAGSGKTTIAVHRLAQAASMPSPVRSLYLSYSGWLVDHARKLYRDVMLARGHDPGVNTPDFFSFADLYRKLAPRDFRERHDHPMNREIFDAWLRKSGLRLDGALVWEELRSILKGACLQLGNPMLDEKDYYELGRKRAPLFVAARPEIYRIAQRYQQWLDQEGRSDQIDFCRQAFRELRHGRLKKYDVIVCDEVQDLTEIEIMFVLSLVSNSALMGLMLAGDMQQIVNPSGFRWAEVRQAVMKFANHGTKAPALTTLSRNFRSVRPLVELANAVLLLRREIFGRSGEDGFEEAVVEGPIPIQVIDDERQVLRAIRDFGPRCAVVVFDEKERDRLAVALETTRIFHIQDAKGLEFESVILWKVLQPAGHLVDRYLRSGSSMEREPRFKHLLQHLYVALTRARRHLAIFEGPEAHPFWNDRRFRGRFETENAETLDRVFRESASPEAWAKEAEYYLERRRYRQAAECYRRAGAVEKEIESHALFAESIEDWNGALNRWKQFGSPERQAPLLERLGRTAEAIEIYAQLGRTEKVQELEIQLLEKQGRWAEAGHQWELLGNIDQALRCYKKSGNRARALAVEAGIAESQSNWAAAAQCWLEIRAFDRAAQCFKKAKDKKNAALAEALHHEIAKDWPKAGAAFRRAGDVRKADECRAIALEASEQPDAAAKIRERLGESDKALRLYRRAGNQRAVERLEFQMVNLDEPQLDRVQSLLERKQPQRAIQLARARCAVLRRKLQSRRPLRSPAVQEMSGELNRLQYLGDRTEAVLAESSKNWKKAARYWRLAGDCETADRAERRAITSIANPQNQGRAWIRFGDYDKAIECFAEAGDAAGATEARARRSELKHDWAQAAAYWESIERTKEQAKCMAQFAREDEDWTAAAHWHRMAGQEKMALAAEKKAKRIAEGRRPRPVQQALF